MLVPDLLPSEAEVKVLELGVEMYKDDTERLLMWYLKLGFKVTDIWHPMDIIMQKEL